MQEVCTSNLSPDISNHEGVCLLILSVPQENDRSYLRLATATSFQVMMMMMIIILIIIILHQSSYYLILNSLQLTTWVRIFLGNFIVPRLSRCCLCCMKEERSWQYSATPTTGLYPEWEESRPYRPTLSPCLYFSPFIHAHFICLDLIKLTFLFHFRCCLCSCIPYCMDSCKSVTHSCPNCKTYLGIYKP